MAIEDLADLGPPHSATRNSGGNWFDYKRNAISLTTSRLLKHTIAHELNHFFLHVSTPYGYFLDELAKAELHHVIGYCSDHVNAVPGASIETPVYPLAKRLREEPELLPPVVRSLIGRHIKPWSHTQFTEDIFEGQEKYLDVPRESALRSLELVEAILRELGGVTAVPPRMHPGLADKNTALLALPSCTWGTLGTFPVGAQHVFEAAAKVYESPPDADRKDIVSRPLYWSLFVTFIYRTVYEDKTHPTPEFNRRLYNTFLGLCDLSLFTPVGSLYGLLRTELTLWYEIHPGSRFFSALSQVRDVGLIENLEKDLLDWQTEVCKRLMWRTPREYLDAGSRAPGARHRAACLKRLEQHSGFLDCYIWPLDQYSRFLVDHLPLQYHAGQDEALVSTPEGGDESPLGVVITWVLERLVRIVMREGAPCWDDLLPPRLNYTELFPANGGRDGIIRLLEQTNLLQLSRYRTSAMTPPQMRGV